MATKRKSRNTRSEIARAAAIKARAIRSAEGSPDVVDSATPCVFVVRDEGRISACRWEVRRFGAIVLFRSEQAYPEPAVARHEGERALARWLSREGGPESRSGTDTSR